MTKLYANLTEMLRENEEGQGLVEYGLILALIAVVCVAAVTQVGGLTADTFTTVAGNL